MLMRSVCVLLTVLLLAVNALAQSTRDLFGQWISYAPLFEYINGYGRIYPGFMLRDGRLLPAGRSYEMLAVPDSGWAFVNWNQVTVFTDTEYTLDGSGNVVVRTFTTVSPTGHFYYRPDLRFTQQPEEVILNEPGVRMVTKNAGWQANFARWSNWWH